TAADFFEIVLNRLNAPVNAAAVCFELRFTRTARSDAAAKPRHRRAASCEARQHVVQLRQLDLQLALASSGSLREDIQNKLVAVQQRHVQRALQVALLRRRELAVEDHQVGFVKVNQVLELGDLARTNQRGGVGADACLDLSLGYCSARGSS